MRPHVLIISQDTCPNQLGTVNGNALARVIESLKERSFAITTTHTLQDGQAALEAYQSITAVVLDWALIDSESAVIEQRMVQYLKHKQLGQVLSKSAALGAESSAHTGRTDTVDADLLPYLKFFPAVAAAPLLKLQAAAQAETSCSPAQGDFLADFVSVALARIRLRNQELPLFVLADRLDLNKLPLVFLQEIEGYIWKCEDTPSFTAGRLDAASRRYLERVTPSFFGHLARYVHDSNYSWHTPGHMGGIGFLKSATGHAFHEFLGENTLRADLSVSVPELGSLLDHTAEVGIAEAEAATTFGAERTYFVTNGTSTSNQIVFHGTVNRGDIVLIDRNCHKTSIQAITAIGCIPLYLNTTTNALNIIGPVPLEELSPHAIREKINACPLIPAEHKQAAVSRIRLAVLTNSTYDGICYDVPLIEAMLRELGVQNILFDEAWFAYACFHPLYQHRHAMGLPPASPSQPKPKGPQVFATQSTHKVLTALSQGSMVHVRDTIVGSHFHERFNEAFMMHSSTSPQYTIIASLDVASRTMAVFGKGLVEDTLIEALTFRDNMERIAHELEREGSWWFQVWQPPGQARKTLQRLQAHDYQDIADGWCLNADQAWHGFHFNDNRQGAYLLDPSKVTLYAPHIPASVVANFLLREGIVVEKTGVNTFLVLFTLGITRGKLGTLISALFKFKKAYDANEPMHTVLPDLSASMPVVQRSMGVQTFCGQLCDALTSMHPIGAIPAQALLPSDAYAHIVSNTLELVPVQESLGRISARIVVPYPPAIPLIMPGERISHDVAHFLSDSERVANLFPGLGVDMHGIESATNGAGQICHHIFCVREQ